MAVARRTEPLSSGGLDRLPAACRACVRWELDPLAAAQAAGDDRVVAAKRDWWAQSLASGGAGGALARLDDQVVGYATWSLPRLAGGSAAAPTAPVSDDAVLLMALWVQPEHRGAGLGRWLTQAVLRQSLRQLGNGRGARAVEVYGDRRDAGRACLAPVDFFVACGFDVVRDHPTTPRLRLDARRLASWRDDVRADVEEVWVRLRGAVRPEPVVQPGRAGRALSVEVRR